MSDILFSEETVDFIRETLLACQIHLAAADQSKSILNGLPETKKSHLTREVEACLEDVESTVKEYVLDKYDREREALETPLPPYEDELGEEID